MPQGSILGVFLYNVATDDLEEQETPDSDASSSSGPESEDSIPWSMSQASSEEDDDQDQAVPEPGRTTSSPAGDAHDLDEAFTPVRTVANLSLIHI